MMVDLLPVVLANLAAMEPSEVIVRDVNGNTLYRASLGFPIERDESIRAIISENGNIVVTLFTVGD